MQPPATFVFPRPREAPVFYPTEAEFQDPVLYIESIRAVSEMFGICRIVPPKVVSVIEWIASSMTADFIPINYLWSPSGSTCLTSML